MVRRRHANACLVNRYLSYCPARPTKSKQQSPAWQAIAAVPLGIVHHGINF